MNTLYFSRKCNHCKEFLMELKSINLIRQFKFICIDGNKNLPKFLKQIPTIITSDYADPLAGDHAFKWIVFKKQQLIDKQQEQEQPEQVELDGFGFGGSSLSFNDINSETSIAADDNLGDFSSLEGQKLIDPKTISDPRIDSTESQRKQMLEQNYVIPRR